MCAPQNWTHLCIHFQRNKCYLKHKVDFLNKIHKKFTQILAKHRHDISIFVCVNDSSVVCNNTGEFQKLWLKVWITLILVTFLEYYFNTNWCSIGKTFSWHCCGSGMTEIACNNIGIKWEILSCCGSNCTTTDVINICVYSSKYLSFFYIWLDILHFSTHFCSYTFIINKISFFIK